MKASFNKVQNNAINYGGNKETIRTYNVIAHKKGIGYSDAPNFKELIVCRVYMARKSDGASPVYASIWLYGADGTVCDYRSGKGTASGYGYCKKSAAVSDAISSAGITLDKAINGRGESAIRDALKAIAEAMGFKQDQIFLVEN
jgi:hypothetical protein